MRRFIVVLALLGCFGGTSRAQVPVPDRGRVATPEQIVESLIARAFKGIALTREQAALVREIVNQSLAEGRALDFGAGDWMEKRKAIIKRRNAAFRAILVTDDDRAKFDVNVMTLPGG
jgi:hypothetical protein